MRPRRRLGCASTVQPGRYRRRGLAPPVRVAAGHSRRNGAARRARPVTGQDMGGPCGSRHRPRASGQDRCHRRAPSGTAERRGRGRERSLHAGSFPRRGWRSTAPPPLRTPSPARRSRWSIVGVAVWPKGAAVNVANPTRNVEGRRLPSTALLTARTRPLARRASRGSVRDRVIGPIASDHGLVRGLVSGRARPGRSPRRRRSAGRAPPVRWR